MAWIASPGEYIQQQHRAMYVNFSIFIISQYNHNICNKHNKFIHNNKIAYIKIIV